MHANLYKYLLYILTLLAIYFNSFRQKGIKKRSFIRILKEMQTKVEANAHKEKHLLLNFLKILFTSSAFRIIIVVHKDLNSRCLSNQILTIEGEDHVYKIRPSALYGKRLYER